MDRYEVLEQLGKGAFGVVSLARRLSDSKLLVIKKVQGSKSEEGDSLADMENEVRVLRKMQHPNITRYEESFLTDEGFCIVQEYAEEGTLADTVSRWKSRGGETDEVAVLDAFAQILLALEHVHAQKVLHRDIKPQNILVAAGGVYKLGDFGLSRVLATSSSKAKTYCGTPNYMSPEVVEGRPYDARSDLWALGCVLYEMVMWRNAFDARSNNELIMQIATSDYPPIPMDRCSAQLRKLVDSMLSHMPEDRPGTGALLAMPLVAAAKGRFESHYAGLLAARPGSSGTGSSGGRLSRNSSAGDLRTAGGLNDDGDGEEGLLGAAEADDLPARLARAMSFDGDDGDASAHGGGNSGGSSPAHPILAPTKPAGGHKRLSNPSTPHGTPPRPPPNPARRTSSLPADW